MQLLVIVCFCFYAVFYFLLQYTVVLSGCLLLSFRSYQCRYCIIQLFLMYSLFLLIVVCKFISVCCRFTADLNVSQNHYSHFRGHVIVRVTVDCCFSFSVVYFFQCRLLHGCVVCVLWNCPPRAIIGIRLLFRENHLVAPCLFVFHFENVFLGKERKMKTVQKQCLV